MSDEVGSMDVVMNYKDSGFKDGMEGAKKDLVEAKGAGKSVNQEMVRLNAVSVATGQAVVDVAKKLFDMFVGALTSSPYLIGAFTRMRTDVQLLFWSISKHLKPAFDLLADAIHAIRKGDWGFFVDTMKDVWGLVITLIGNTWTWIKEHSGDSLGSIMEWGEGVYNAVTEWLGKVWEFISSIDWEGGENGPWEKFKEAAIIAFKWIVDKVLPDWLTDFISGIGLWMDENSEIMQDTWLKLTKDIPWGTMGGNAADQFVAGFLKAAVSPITNFFSSLSGGLRLAGDEYLIPETSAPYAATGLYVPSDGLYRLHAGENVTPANSSQGSKGASGGGPISIIVDFSNAAINLASGIDLDTFADTISNRIAERQAWESF
jgi:hypothetical protein